MKTKPNFRSIFEGDVFNPLKKIKDIEAYYEPSDEKIVYVSEHSYLIDILLTNPSKTRKIYIECKGWFRPSDRAKMDKVIKSNPHLDIRFVFMQDNYLTKRKKKKYSDWCKQRNVKYALKEIPKEWLDELRD